MPAPPVSRLSVIIPCLDEGALVRPALRALQPLRDQGCELLLVDGGSRDGSREQLESLGLRWIGAERLADIRSFDGASAPVIEQPNPCEYSMTGSVRAGALHSQPSRSVQLKPSMQRQP